MKHNVNIMISRGRYDYAKVGYVLWILKIKKETGFRIG